jgi:hypothetical protein
MSRRSNLLHDLVLVLERLPTLISPSSFSLLLLAPPDDFNVSRSLRASSTVRLYALHWVHTGDLIMIAITTQRLLNARWSSKAHLMFRPVQLGSTIAARSADHGGVTF